jgi:phosphonate transport system substrate-binding protein
MKLVYYHWITQDRTPEVKAEQVKVFARLIAEKLGPGETIEVMPPVEVPEQIDHAIAGTADIALMNPLGLVIARMKNINAEAVAIAKRMIDGQVGISYFAQLYAHKKNALRNPDANRDPNIVLDPQKAFEKVRKTPRELSVGYGHTYSTSNFLIPALMLRQGGVHPFFNFGRVQYFDGHDFVAKAVYENKVDLGAGHDGVIKVLAGVRGYGDAEDVLVQVARSKPIPSDPVVVTTPDAGRRAALKRAIVEAGESEEGKKALDIFWGKVQGLAETTSEPYGVLIDAMNTLKLEPPDVIPPPPKKT